MPKNNSKSRKAQRKIVVERNERHNRQDRIELSLDWDFEDQENYSLVSVDSESELMLAIDYGDWEAASSLVWADKNHPSNVNFGKKD